MRRGQVVIVEIPSPDPLNPSHIQAGTRPAAVLQVDAAINALQTVVVVPFTGQLKARRFPFAVEIQPSILNSLDQPSVALVHQIFTTDQRDVIDTIGELDSADLEQIESSLKRFLGLSNAQEDPE